MRSAKEQGKIARKNAAVLKTLRKKKSLKVVEVKLRGKGQTKSATASKKTEPVSKKALVEVAKAAKKVANAAAKIPAKGLEKMAVTVEKTLETQPSGLTPEMLLAPTESILKPFRRAAELNRKLAKKNARANGKNSGFLAKPNKKNKRYIVDLRVQSPGTVGYFANGGINPGPALIRLAGVKGIDILGLTDFYNAAYVDVVNASVTDPTLTILPGVDLCCRLGACGEVFLTVLFPEKTPAAEIFALLDELAVPKYAYGRKSYCLEMPFAQVLEAAERRGALIIPTRIDKTPYRQLAIKHLVEDFGFHAFDLAHPDSPELFRERWPQGGFTFVSFSNANALGQIGNRVGKLHLSQPGFLGLKELLERKKQATVCQGTAVE